MSKTYTVVDVARLSGVSVRTLHHYDQIGLLKPAFVGTNRYRHYEREQLLRLQQILLYRELDIPLGEIGAILDAPGFDRVESLKGQRDRLAAEARRYAELLRTIDRTIADLQGDRTMMIEDLYKGVSLEKQAEYEAWLIDTQGPWMEGDIAESKARRAGTSAEQLAAAMAELASIEQALAEGLRRGVAADASALDPALGRHRAWVANAWGRPCSPEAYAGLADIYQHPDFRTRFDTIEPGFADYLIAAMKAWVGRQR